MGFLFSTSTVVLLIFARRTQADTCPDTSPPTLQVPIYQVAVNSPLTTQYIHFPSLAPFNNDTAKTIYQIDGMFASTSASTCIAAGCLITLQVMGNQNGNNISIYTIPSSWASSTNYQGFVTLTTLNCVQTYGACGATIPLYAYENTKYADEYVNVGYGTDAPSGDGYNPMNGGIPLCFLWPVPTTTSTTTTTTTTPFTGSTTTGPTTSTATTLSTTTGSTVSTTPFTGSTTTETTVSTTSYTGSTTTGSTVSTTPFTGSTTTGTTVSTTSFTGSTTTGTTVSTTSFTGSTTTGTTATTTLYTGPTTSTDSTTTGSTTPYTGSTTTAPSTTPYTGSSTTEASTLPYTGPSTTAGQSTLSSLGKKIGWPIWIAGVLIAALAIVAVIFGATWAFIRSGSTKNPTTNPYANQAHGYKAAHADLPPQPVQPANAGVSTMNVGPTWTQPHSMYY